MKGQIIGVGKYAPGEPISNAELTKLTGVEFDHEKFAKGLGIENRHIAKLRGIEETSADFATKAAENAIKNAGIDPMDVDLFIVGSDTPEYISPATAIMVQGRIQKTQKAGAFDIAASCASFTIAYDVANHFIKSGTYKTICVIGVYAMTNFIRYDKNDKDAPFNIPIFADGAGAVILKAVDASSKSEYLASEIIGDGTQWDFLGVYAGGTKRPFSPENVDALKDGKYGLENLKPLPGDRNVKLWPTLVKDTLKKANLKVEDVKLFVFTQINRSVIKKVMAELDMPLEQAVTVMDKYGYTGSGCVPMAFYHAIEDKMVERGDVVVFCASGSGFAVCCNVFKY
jgi:3-oxoacyl-[acyl-carrier-protein] synthase-3